MDKDKIRAAPTEAGVKQPQSDAKRSRRYRDRKKTGGCCFRIDVDGSDISQLVSIGLLSADQRNNADAVRSAVMRLSSIGFRTLKAQSQGAR